MKDVALRRIARFAYGDSLAADDRVDGPIPVFGSNGVVGSHVEPNTMSPVIIVGRKGSYGAVNYSELPAFAIDTTYYVDESLTGADIRWLYYALQSAQLGAVSADTGVPGLSREVAYATRMPWVDGQAQCRIADFLDRETARIDALVDKKQRLIDLLEEKRTATITQTATKGLDPTVPMKDSGIPWIGKVPEHWDVTRLKHVARIEGGITLGTRYAQPLVDVPYLRVANVQDGYFELSDVATISLPPQVSERHRLRVGDVLLLEGNGNPQNLGRGAVWNGEIRHCLHQNHIHVVRVDKRRLLPHFLEVVVRTEWAREFFASGSTQVSIATLSKTKLGTLPIPVPSLEEQQAILDSIGLIGDATESCCVALGKQLLLLAEYREALITAAVTGEIDVDTFNTDQRMEEVAG